MALSKKDKWDREIIVIKAYTYESSLTAYGYMSKDSNTCVNIGYGKDEYGRPKWAGGFDLRISGLTQVTKNRIVRTRQELLRLLCRYHQVPRSVEQTSQTSGEPSVGRDSRHQDRTH